MQSSDVAYLDPGKGIPEKDEGDVEREGELIEEEEEEEEELFPFTCPNSGCKFSIADESEEKKMTNHSKVCEYQVSLISSCSAECEMLSNVVGDFAQNQFIQMY